MQVIIDSVKVEGKEYKRNWKEKLSDGLHNTADWIRDNKDTVVLFIPVATTAITGVVKITKGIIKLGVASKERKVTDRRCYDPSEGHYWALRRALTNDDWLKVSHRQASGERLGDILADMNLLKR